VSDELAAVKRAAKRKREADQAYRDSIAAAHEAGFPFVEIAEAAGVTRQSVRVIVRRRQGFSV
jgi:predicted transcriptional regulator